MPVIFDLNSPEFANQTTQDGANIQRTRNGSDDGLPQILAPPVVQPETKQARTLSVITEPDVKGPIVRDLPQIFPASNLPTGEKLVESLPAQMIPAPANRRELPVMSEPTTEDAVKTFAPRNLPVIGEPEKSIEQKRVLPVISDLRKTQNEINALNAKDYSKAQYDDNGNLIKAAGKDRDKIGSAMLGDLEGLAQGGIGGAIAGGVRAGTNRNYLEQKETSEIPLF